MSQLKVGDKIFNLSYTSIIKKVHDLNIVSNFDINLYDKYFLDHSIYEVYAKNWRYYTEVCRNNVSIANMKDRVRNGDILAYFLAEGSSDMGGIPTNTFSYGWIKPNAEEFDLTSKHTNLSGLRSWPKEVYFFIENVGNCLMCPPGCIRCVYNSRFKEETNMYQKNCLV